MRSVVGVTEAMDNLRVAAFDATNSMRRLDLSRRQYVIQEEP
jgi:hypothetical protein